RVATENRRPPVRSAQVGVLVGKDDVEVRHLYLLTVGKAELCRRRGSERRLHSRTPCRVRGSPQIARGRSVRVEGRGGTGDHSARSRRRANAIRRQLRERRNATGREGE